MTQTAESVWNRLTGTNLEEKEETAEKPSLSSNLELERKVEEALKEALKEARWDENPTTLSYNIIEAFRKNGLVIGTLPQ